jgi:hypothetical protein
MRLTVGPLPPAVYWRRRAAIAGILLLLVLGLVYSCSNRSDASQRKRVLTPSTGGPSPTASVATSPSVSPSADTSPESDGSVSPEPVASTKPSEQVTPSGPCEDTDMSVTAVPDSTSVPRGSFVKFTLKIKNTSDRTCTRDVGADAQELYLQDASKAKVWSSDDCDASHGTDVRTFRPSIETEFWQVWDGKASNAGCAARQPPPAGRYQLVGRLATKLSAPVDIELK